MKVGIELSIDCTKIDQTRLYKGANGAKYMTCTVWIDANEADKFGYHGMITMKQTQEERQAKTYTPIVGNGKMFWNDSGAPIASKENSAPPSGSNQAPSGSGNAPSDNFDDDIPF